MTKDAKILRDLAYIYREYAFSDENAQKKRLHKAVVDLHMIEPVVLIDELPWHELNQTGELTLYCDDPFLREIECQMRQTIFRRKYIPADMVVPEAIRVDKVIRSTGIGMEVKGSIIHKDINNRVGSRNFIDQMEDESCLEQFHNEVITYDKEESERRYELVANMIGDIMPVRLIGSQWVFNTLWDDVAQLHGVENLLMDIIERPDYLHAIARKLTDIFKDKVRQYEELNLFEGAQDLVHCTAAYTDQLPSEAFDGEHYKAKDVWGRGCAQIFVSASPAVREEFDIPYMCEAMEPFGLVYYGCCEPLHKQIDIVSRIPHLRKITVTPWADYYMAAEQIGKRFVASTKASSASVAMPSMNEESLRKELSMIVDACYRNGCPFELTLKDVTTVSYHPENLRIWEKMAMELVHNR